MWHWCRGDVALAEFPCTLPASNLGLWGQAGSASTSPRAELWELLKSFCPTSSDVQSDINHQRNESPPPPLWKAEVRLLLIARSRATFWIINDLHARGKSSCSSWAERDWNLAFTQGTLCETGHLKLFLQMAPSRETCKGRRNHQNESRKNNTCLCLQYLESFVSRRKRALRIMVNQQTSSVQQVYLLKLNS